MSVVDVTVARGADDHLAVKLQTDEWEVNFHGSSADLVKLRRIRAAQWDERRSIRAGESAGAHVFWAIAGDRATLMIGRDDETWDVAVTIPLEAIEEIAREAERAAAR